MSEYDLCCIIYHHRHGTDVIPYKLKKGVKHPEITNEMLIEVGIDDPELGEREDEYAEWYDFIPLDHWPVIGG